MWMQTIPLFLLLHLPTCTICSNRHPPPQLYEAEAPAQTPSPPRYVAPIPPTPASLPSPQNGPNLGPTRPIPAAGCVIGRGPRRVSHDRGLHAAHAHARWQGRVRAADMHEGYRWGGTVERRRREVCSWRHIHSIVGRWRLGMELV